MAKIGSQKTCKAFTNDYSRCNKVFLVNHPKQKFCSDRCRKRNNRKIKERVTKKNAKEELKIEKQNELFKSKIYNARNLHNDIMKLSLEIDYFNTPIFIPKEKSITDFLNMDSFYMYTVKRTNLEREELRRKDLKKIRIKELKSILKMKIGKLITIKSFIPDSNKKHKEEINNIISNLEKMKNPIGKLTREQTREEEPNWFNI